MKITEFLLARVAEDEAFAMMAADIQPMSAGESRRVEEGNAVFVTIPFAATPARVLVECEAKRRIVDLATFSDSDRSAVDFWLEPDQRDLTPPGFTAAMIGVLQSLAAVYADHPDYDRAWSPTG